MLQEEIMDLTKIPEEYLKFADIERVQKRIAYWDKQNNNVPAPKCMLKVQGEIIKVEGL